MHEQICNQLHIFISIVGIKKNLFLFLLFLLPVLLHPFLIFVFFEQITLILPITQWLLRNASAVPCQHFCLFFHLFFLSFTLSIFAIFFFFFLKSHQPRNQSENHRRTCVIPRSKTNVLTYSLPPPYTTGIGNFFLFFFRRFWMNKHSQKLLNKKKISLDIVIRIVFYLCGNFVIAPLIIIFPILPSIIFR